MIYKVCIFLAFFPPGKSDRGYHPLKTEMLVFWAGLEISQDSVTILGTSPHLLEDRTERAAPVDARDLPVESHPQPPESQRSRAWGAGSLGGFFGATASSSWLSALA